MRISLEVAERWGLPIAPKKIIAPCVDPTFLGVRSQHDDETHEFTEERRLRWATEAETMGNSTMLAKSKLKSFLHKVIWSAQYLVPELMPVVCPVFYITKYNYPSRKGMIQNTAALKARLLQAAKMIRAAPGIAMMPSLRFPDEDAEECCTTYTDASGTGTKGVGGSCLPFYFMTKFRKHEAGLSVPIKEHIAVELWAATLQRKLNPQYMLQYSDALDVVLIHEKNKSGMDHLALIQERGARRDAKTGMVRKLKHVYRRFNQGADDLSKLDEAAFKLTCRKEGYTGNFIRLTIPEDIRDTRWLTSKPTIRDVALDQRVQAPKLRPTISTAQPDTTKYEEGRCINGCGRPTDPAPLPHGGPRGACSQLCYDEHRATQAAHELCQIGAQMSE